MPRNVRNAWICVGVDGRKAPMEGGPRSKDGGLHADLLVREAGHVRMALSTHAEPARTPDRILTYAVVRGPAWVLVLPGGEKIPAPDGSYLRLETPR